MGKQYGLIYSISFRFTAALGALSWTLKKKLNGWNQVLMNYKF
jgi:hypothetical protein